MQAGIGPVAEVSSGGTYAVQVTSERSAAEAHASFRALRAKFPNQLGGREPIVRRTDLGAKGIYYRTMVGPFASMEKAVGMCRTLKAAGGNCLINEIERRARPSVGMLLVLIFQAPHPSTMNGDNLD